MKELTIEQKAKAYDEALKRAIAAHKDEDRHLKATLERIFPELKESEDEKIRKVLKHYLEVRRCQTQSDEEYINCNNFLAWLDRQGTSYTKRDVDDAYVEGMAFAKDELERQGEQKPVDKVGPKFKVGDWCIDNEDGTIFQIVKVLDNTYTYKTNEGKEYSCSHYSLENDAHLWTIQDAKDGDVLVADSRPFIYNGSKNEVTVGAYCGFNVEHKFSFAHNYVINRNITPATKEQRDTLFAKMKEAGYEWDAEKKELKKIELTDVGHEYYSELLKNDKSDNIADYAYQCVYCMSHDWTIENPTWDNVQSACRLGAKWQKKHDVSEDWSEEDEIKIKSIVAFLKSPSLCAMDGNKGIIDANIKYLKSIKDRVQPQDTWKPSDAQIRALEYIINNAHNTSYSCKIAKELLEQLKKLKGE